jgi:hypothetical protein
MPTIPVFWRLRQEDHEFKASLGHIVSSRSAWAMCQDPTSNNKKTKQMLFSHKFTTRLYENRTWTSSVCSDPIYMLAGLGMIPRQFGQTPGCMLLYRYFSKKMNI